MTDTLKSQLTNVVKITSGIGEDNTSHSFGLHELHKYEHAWTIYLICIAN